MLRLFTQDGSYNETLDLLRSSGPMLNLDVNVMMNFGKPVRILCGV